MNQKEHCWRTDGAIPMNNRSDVVIIGAGIVGLACAEQFSRRGARVIILDRHLPGAGQTTRTGGGIRLAHGSELNVSLSLRSFPVWARFAEAFGVDIDYRETGHLFLTSTPEQIDTFRAQADLQKRLGLSSVILDKGQIAKQWPHLRNVDSTHGLFCREGGYVNHHRVVDGYVRALLRSGVTLELGRRVENIIQEAGRVVGVETSHGTYRADTVVNAAGPLAGRFTSQVGGRDPFLNRRHELLIVRPKNPVHSLMPWVIDTDRQVHLRPDGDGRALVGGFLGHDRATDPERFEHGYTDEWARDVRKAACDAFGITEAACPIVTGWAGLYPGTSDYLPIAEVTAPGMITIAGLSGTGLMHAPAMAEIAWDLVNSVETPWIDATTLSSRRFETCDRQFESTGF